jgi:hypothetical protein
VPVRASPDGNIPPATTYLTLYDANPGAMKELVQSLKENTKSLWDNSGTEFQENGIHYSVTDQSQNEQEMDRLIQPLVDKFGDSPSGFRRSKTQFKKDKSGFDRYGIGRKT